MAYKVTGFDIIDESRRIINASVVGVGTTIPTTGSTKLYVVGDSWTTGIATFNVAQGTAPISVASSTRVDNFNANYLNGRDEAFFRNASNLNAGAVPGAQVTSSNGLNITGNLNVSGNVSIAGTTFGINIQQLTIQDRDIVLGLVTSVGTGIETGTDATATHGGISIASTTGSPLFDMPQVAGINSLPFTYKQFMWISSATGGAYSGVATDAWISNYALGIGTLAVRNGSRLTVGAGFTVFDTYLDATDIRARNISTVNNINASGIVTANSFKGDGSQLTNINVGSISGAIAGVTIRDENSTVGTAGSVTSLNFVGGNIVATASGVGATITISDNLVGTALSISGISTFGSGGGISTFQSSLFGTQASFTGIVTAGTFSGQVNAGVGTITTGNITNISGTNLNYTGVSTITDIRSNTNINSSGIHTAATYNVGATTVLNTVNSQITLAGIQTIDATTKAALERELAFAPNQFDDLSVTGISTFTNGPVLIGTATSTGTASQVLQVGSAGATRGAYFSGNVGVGTTNPGRLLDVNGDVRLRAALYDFNNQSGSAGQFLTVTGAGVSWTTISGVAAGTISTAASVAVTAATNQTGNILFATAGTGASIYNDTDLSYDSSTNKLTINNAVVGAAVTINNSGITVVGVVTATDFNSSSDRTLKHDIQVIQNPIEKVLQLNGVTFNWNESGKPSVGVIAQEVEQVLPELVSDTDPKSVNYNGLIGLLIECVKEQQKQIDELKQVTAKKPRKPKTV